MKILMVNKFLHANGGSETYTFQLGSYLSEQGHEVQYFGMDHPNRVVGNEWDIYTDNMDFHTSKFQKIFYPFKILYSLEAKKKMRIVLEKFQPHVVHVNNFNFQLTPSILYAVREYDKKHGKKTRIIFTAHDYQLICPNHMMYNQTLQKNCDLCKVKSGLQCTKYKCIHQSRIKSFLGTVEHGVYDLLGTYQMIDCIVCPSEFLKQQFAGVKHLEDKVITMHNFVEKSTQNIGKKEDYVLYFGRYSFEKGIGTLIEVCKQLPHIPFVFAGKGPLEATVNEVENITNLGFLSGRELEDVIRKAQFSIYPSEWYENCPFSVMESQLMGTPVIGADMGGIPELIQVGKTGVLFQSGDVDDLISVIERLWQNAEELKGYQVCCQHYQATTLEQYADNLLHAIYRVE